MYGRGLDGLMYLVKYLIIALIIILPFGVWKIIDLLIWLMRNVKISV